MRQYILAKIRKSKKIISVFLILSLVLSLTACGFKEPTGYGQALSQLDNMIDITEEDIDDNFDNSGEIFDYAEEDNEEFENFLMDCFKDQVTGDSIEYNYSVKNGDDYGIEPPEATLGDSTLNKEVFDKEQKKDEERLEKLLSFENAPLTENERFMYECMKTEMEMNMHSYDNIYFFEPFSPMRGWHANIPTNFTDYRFDDKSDVEDYVIMMGQMRDFFDGLINYEYEKSEAGYFMADAVCEKVIEQCDEFIAEKDNHFLIQVFNDRVEELDFLSDEEKEEYKERNKEAVINSAIPAFEDLKNAMNELKGTGTNDLGLFYYEGGKDYYSNYIFPLYSGSAKSPAKEIQIIDNRYKKLYLEMNMIYSENPTAYKLYIETYDSLFSSYDSMEASELIDYLIDNCMDEYPEIQRIPYKANYLDKPMEKILDSALAYYMSPAVDDKENNIIYVNGAHKSGLWTTLAHEGCPGHMYQNAYFQSTNPNPYFALQNNLGYKEGWAVYSSYNSLSKCDFDDSPYADVFAELTKIEEDLGYLIYGRVDLGVNYEGWNKEDVIAYLEKTGVNSSVADELMQTVIGDPGVYLSYTVGYYEMEELRQRAEDALGDKFDPIQFHETILKAGPCQYENLSTRVNKYIKENE